MQPPFETFSNLQGNKLWKAQPSHDSSTVNAGLYEKCYSSGKKNLAANLIPKSLVTSPANA